MVGDWNGDGVDTIGIFGMPRNGRPFPIGFFLSNPNTVPSNDLVFGFGAPGDQPITGDWDGQP